MKPKNKTDWSVGDRVRTSLDHAWVYEGTERQGLMGRDRHGTIIDVPECHTENGFQTVLIRWESLTSVPLKRSDWWTHTSLILAA